MYSVRKGVLGNFTKFTVPETLFYEGVGTGVPVNFSQNTSR